MLNRQPSSFQKWDKISQIVYGQSISPGITEGMAFKYEHIPSPLNPIEIQKNTLDKIFQTIIDNLSKSLNNPEITTQYKDFIRTQHTFFSDRKLQERILLKMTQSKTMETAIQEVFEDLQNKFRQDHFWQSRITEFKEMTLHLVNQETVEQHQALLKPFDAPTILVTRWINPEKLISLPSLNVKSLILVNSSELSHLAILVKSLNIPVLGIQSEYEKNIQTGDPLLINTYEGAIHIRPEPDLPRNVRKQYEKPYQLTFLPHFNEQGVLKSLDGITIKLSINVNIPSELKALEQTNIQGVGLFRSEFPFILQGKMLSLREQVNLYKSLYDQSQKKPIYFRTLDISGDKIFPIFENKLEAQKNRKITQWQSSRIAIDRPFILRRQIRALLKARMESLYPNEPIHVMFPMISDIQELLSVKKLVNIEEEYFKKSTGQYAPKIYTGVVIEIPSLVHQLDKILPLIDFATIGSNDLFHFFYATNRYDSYRKDQHDSLSDNFLSYLKSINDLFEQNDMELCLCGEMASTPLEAMSVLSQGFRSLSISPINLEKICEMIQSCNIKDLEKFYQSFQENAWGPKGATMNLRQHLTAYAKNHSIAI